MAEHCTHTFRKIINTHVWKHKPHLRTYRFRCRSCGHRWNVYFDKVANKEVQLSLRELPVNRRRMTPKEVKMILEDWRFDDTLAEALGISRQSVHSIRTGRTYKEMFPEIPRRRLKQRQQEGNGCVTCKHWHGDYCDLGIPEGGEAGFFRECSCFSE